MSPVSRSFPLGSGAAALLVAGDDEDAAPTAPTIAAGGSTPVLGVAFDGRVLEQRIVNQPLPSVPTPTAADPFGVQTIGTQDPTCPLHEVTLAGVAVCGPVLELLVGAVTAQPELAVIHLDVYPNGEPSAGSLSAALASALA